MQNIYSMPLVEQICVSKRVREVRVDITDDISSLGSLSNTYNKAKPRKFSTALRKYTGYVFYALVIKSKGDLLGSPNAVVG